MTSSNRVLMTGVALGLVTLSATSRHRVAVPTSNPAVVINVDAAANRHAIDPRIYGAAFADASSIADLGITINRWGGNAMSTYNWAFSTANRCKDFYFENISGDSADDFVNQTNAGGAQPITIPLLSWPPKSATFNCGFRISKYGPQDGFDGYSGTTDCGSGKLNGNRLLHVNDPADTSAMYTSAHQADWVQHLVSTFGYRIGRWRALLRPRQRAGTVELRSLGRSS